MSIDISIDKVSPHSRKTTLIKELKYKSEMRFWSEYKLLAIRTDRMDLQESI